MSRGRRGAAHPLRGSAALIAAAVLAPAFAHAGDLSVTLFDQHGAPVADAVVTVAIPGYATPARFGQPLRMSQRDLMFMPHVLVAPVGAEVNFANEDKVRHQIYSFSPAKRFELKLFGKDQTHSVRFDKPGVVALGCNIHDAMTAFIKVVDAPFAAITDASGRALFRDLPASSAEVGVWQPYLHAPGNALRGVVLVPKIGSIERVFSAPIVAPRP